MFALQIPLYIWAPEEEGQFQPGRCSRWWLKQSLASFKTDLQALGSDLVFTRATESRQALIQLVEETGAQAVLFNHLYDPISLVRDNEVKTAMQKMQVWLSASLHMAHPFLGLLFVGVATPFPGCYTLQFPCLRLGGVSYKRSAL